MTCAERSRGQLMDFTRSTLRSSAKRARAPARAVFIILLDERVVKLMFEQMEVAAVLDLRLHLSGSHSL